MSLQKKVTLTALQVSYLCTKVFLFSALILAFNFLSIPIDRHPLRPKANLVLFNYRLTRYAINHSLSQFKIVLHALLLV